MSGLYDKALLQQARLHPTTLQFWFTVDNVGLQVALCAGWWWKQRAVVPFTFRWTVPLVGVLLVAADQFYFRALAQEDALVSVVALARRASVLVSFSLGGWLFREHLLKQKSGALALILAGLLILLWG
jgi:transporter family protein